MKRSNLSAAVVGALAATTLTGGIAWAAIPDHDGAIHGCYTKVGGVLRVIDTAKGQKCLANLEVPITWNERGPKGDPGTAGVDGAPGRQGEPGPAGPPGPSGAASLDALDGTSCNLGAPSEGVLDVHYEPGTNEISISCNAPHLRVTRAGIGAGSVVSDPAGIDCGATCQYHFRVGTEVRLTATPADGNVFTGWGGACTGTAACVVTMNESASVSVQFTPESRLIVEVAGYSRPDCDGVSIPCEPGGGAVVSTPGRELQRQWPRR